jgi:hypothetical protein
MLMLMQMVSNVSKAIKAHDRCHIHTAAITQDMFTAMQAMKLPVNTSPSSHWPAHMLVSHAHIVPTNTNDVCVTRCVKMHVAITAPSSRSGLRACW